MNLAPHPFGNHGGPLFPAPTGPWTTSPQRGMGYRFCLRCADDKPAKGGRIVNGGFECAAHQRKDEQ